MVKRTRVTRLTQNKPKSDDEGVKLQHVQADPNKGLRYSGNKPRFDLIPPDALMALSELYTVGTKKYDVHNWEKGMPWSNCYSPMMRHANAFWGGERYDNDPALGKPIHHMIAVAWNALALYCYDMRQIGEDDRWPLPKHMHDIMFSYRELPSK